MAEYRQKKIAMINDLSGYGRCSLTVAIPILSAMKIQCCPVPTSILSNHTGFPVYFFDDYTEKMPSYIDKWKELDLSFDGIVSGFLGSEAQIEIVKDIIRNFGGEDTTIIVDPIMGDHGETYATFTPALCSRMRELVAMGNVVTPNLTEACILTDRPFSRKGWTREQLKALAREIQAMGPEAVVITGVNQGGYVVNVVAEGNREITFPKTIRIGKERPGTGDVFSSVVASGVVAGWELEEAVRLAASFVKKCIKRSDELDIPLQNGVCFEELLGVLVHATDRLQG
ncbi:MAG: pyridoxamine kinase [Clostridium sp.]|nr:pyridoxamine kinase [Clostridium sp.]